jgi:uncharacterized protein
MKPVSNFFMFIILIIGLTLESGKTYSNPAVFYSRDTLSGIWVGELEIPHAAKLRMGLIISKDTSDSYKAILNIVDQATGDIPCDGVIYKNDSVIVKLNGLGIVVAGSIDKDFKTFRSEFRQGGGAFHVIFTRVDKLPVLNRPQEPKKPYPYKEENVVFENKKAAIKLAGTLTIPSSKKKVPAVILVTGSGQQDRNEEIGKHKPFWILADYLTRNGIAVLRVDDRGIGGSTGDFDKSTTGDFAGDALAGIEYLKSRKEIDTRKIGIIGHSEGGSIAPLAATLSPDISFVVAMAGVFVNFQDIAMDQISEQERQQGIKDADIAFEMKWREKIYNIAKENTDSLTAATKLWAIYNELSNDEKERMNWPKGRQEAQIKQVLNPWWRYILGMDNKAILLRVKCPVLALYGELDQQVDPAKNILIIDSASKERGDNKITVKKLPHLNHLFQTAETGSEYEYTRIEETISPVALNVISDWILKQAR